MSSSDNAADCGGGRYTGKAAGEAGAGIAEETEVVGREGEAVTGGAAEAGGAPAFRF